jgi:hypothetical protein
MWLEYKKDNMLARYFNLLQLKSSVKICYFPHPEFPRGTCVSLEQITPNVAAEWLTLLLRIREIPGSELVTRPAVLTTVFRCFPQSLQVHSRIVP